MNQATITHLRFKVDSAWTPQAIERARAFDLAKYLSKDLATIDPLLLPYLAPIFERLAPDATGEGNRPVFVVLPELVTERADQEHAPTQGKRRQPRKSTQALMMMHEHPEWTDTQIAEAVGCERSSLYRMKGFKQAKEALRGGRGEFGQWNQGEGHWQDDE